MVTIIQVKIKGVVLSIGDTITVNYKPMGEPDEQEELDPVTKKVVIGSFKPSNDGEDVRIISEAGESFTDCDFVMLNEKAQ